MSKQLRFYALLRDSSAVRKVEMDSATANSVSSRFVKMSEALFPADAQKKKYHPLDAIAEDDEESIFATKFSLPPKLAELAEKGDIPGPLTEDHVLGGRVRAIVALSQTTKDPLYVFQAIPRRDIIRPGLALFVSADTFRERTEPSLVLGERLHAAWQAGELMFRKESDARKVVDFSSVFGPATDKQLASFAQHEKVGCNTVWLKEAASDFYRRRIAAVLSSGILDTHSIDELKNAAKSVKFNLL